MAIRIFVADGRGMVREGLILLLRAHPDIEVVGGAAGCAEAAREVRRLQPDVVLMDGSMTGPNGSDATLEVRKAHPAAKLLMLALWASSEQIFHALQSGVRGYLLLESSGEELLDAVRSVHAGQRYLSKQIAGTVIDDYVRDRHQASPLASLSRRERQILQLVAEGKSSAHAARILFLSPKTVETYRSRLMRKLGVENFPSLIKFAIQHGVVPLDN